MPSLENLARIGLDAVMGIAAGSLESVSAIHNAGIGSMNEILGWNLPLAD